MREVGATIFGLVLFLAVVLTLAWVFTANDVQLQKTFAPVREDIRREVFEHSRAFNEGMVQELQNMQFKYVQEKDASARDALANIILHRAAGYNLDDPAVPASLRSFISSLKNERAR